MSDLVPSVLVIVYEELPNAFDSPMGLPEPFWAMVASHPDMRQNGATEQEAVDGLRRLILCRVPPRAKNVKLVDLELNSLVAAEVLSQ